MDVSDYPDDLFYDMNNQIWYAARAAFDGVVVAHNEDVISQPELIGRDAFGTGWMLVVQPARADWREGLVTGQAIAPAFAAWLATEVYKDRAN